MSNKYLLRVSLAMIVISVIGLAAFYTMRGSLPPVPSWQWPEETATGERLDDAAQLRAVQALRAQASAKVRFLAGAEAVERLDRAEPSQPDKVSFDEKYRTRELFQSARFHASAVIILLWITLACGLLGLARLRVRGLVAVGGAILVLAILGGGAVLVFTGASTLAAIMLPFMLLGFFGQLVGANLVPGANHPFVVQAENELRALPPARRRAHITKRIIGGILLFVLGCGMTALSLAIHAGVVVVATGAIAGGLFMMTTPLLALVRMRIAR